MPAIDQLETFVASVTAMKYEPGAAEPAQLHENTPGPESLELQVPVTSCVAAS